MTDTPARDALTDSVFARVHRAAGRTRKDPRLLAHSVSAVVAVDTILDDHDLVVAALVESGWKPTPDQLRALGGMPVAGLHDSWCFPQEVDGD